MRCRVCNEKKLKKIFSLGKQPLANNLLDKPGKTKTYPLEWLRCEHCGMVQLSYVVPKEMMFDNYYYIPSMSKDHLIDFQNMADSLIKDLELKRGDLVVDVGGSDGSLLKCFKGMNKLNIEPAKNIKIDVPVIREYLSPKVAKRVVKQFGKAKLVMMTNVFAHIDNLQEVIECLDILLDTDGVFFARFPNLRNLLEQTQFDTIYHEHLSYFTYESLYHLFTNTPFELYQVKETPIHGGSMMIYVRRKVSIELFVKNATKVKEDLLDCLIELKSKGKKIVGFGAAAKGTVLLNACGIDNLLVDYVVDDTPYKIGKIIPGVDIPVVASSVLKTDKPDVMLILAWNWKEEIMRKYPGYIYVVPIPRLEVISA